MKTTSTVLLMSYLITVSCTSKSKTDDQPSKPIGIRVENCDALKNSLRDFRSGSSYIRLIVKSGNREKELIVNNDSFYSSFGKSEGYDEEKYFKNLYEVIRNEKHLSLSDQIWKIFATEMIDVDQNLIDDDVILEDYFRNNIQIKKIPNELRVISSLIRQSYQVWTDDESGFLVLRKCE